LFHIFVFIAGAKITGLLNAHKSEVKRLSQMPFASLPIVFAVAGARTKISASSTRAICLTLYS
jgi:hypothetical protein